MSENAKHTPGPWRSEAADTRQFTYDVLDPRGCYVAIASERGHTPETAANAKLIAAAPDLLEALTALVNYAPVRNALAPRDSLGSLLAQAEAAITKATQGEQDDAASAACDVLTLQSKNAGSVAD